MHVLCANHPRAGEPLQREGKQIQTSTPCPAAGDINTSHVSADVERSFPAAPHTWDLITLPQRPPHRTLTSVEMNGHQDDTVP